MAFATINQVKDFIELRKTFAASGLNKLLKGYDENSGESVLEDKIYYSMYELDVYKNSIKVYLEGTNKNFTTQEFTKWLMVARGLIIKNVQLEELSEDDNQKMFKLFMKMQNLFTYLDKHSSVDKEIIRRPCEEIIKHIDEIKKIKEVN